jgi:hypothetical protein
MRVLTLKLIRGNAFELIYIYRRHPSVSGDDGCSFTVWMAVPPRVTVQSNLGVAIPAAVGAFINRCQLSSLLLSGSFLCCGLDLLSLCAHCTLSDCCSPGCAVLGLAFPCVGVDGALDHVPFVSALKPQFRASCFPTTLDQLSIKKVFWDAACVHSSHAADPSEASFCQDCVEAARVGLFQYLRIGDPILPRSEECVEGLSYGSY